MAENDNLLLGIAAAQNGELEKARSYLAQAVKENPRSEEGWLWLGRCLTDKEQQKYCFERALQLDPQNAKAQNELDRLFLAGVAQHSVSSTDLPKEAQLRRISGENKADWYSNPAFLWIMGIIAGLCICGVPLLFFVNSGLSDPLAGLLPSRAPLASPSPIPFPIVSATAISAENDFIVSATPSRPIDVNTNMWKIRDLRSQGKHAEAIILLDEVIQAAPELDEAYFLRASSYQSLMRQQRSIFEYQEYLDKAMADIDQAIAIRPDSGDYYMLRQSILTNLAGMQNYRVDADRVTEYALENARAALSLGTTIEEYPDRIYAIDLIYANRCEEALELLQTMIDRTDPADRSIGGLYHTQSQAYTCLNQVDRAIEMLDKSMFNNMNMEWKYELKARYLYQAGRSEEALELLNELLEQKPSYDGWRYYLRALIYQEMGEREKAEEDLRMGAGNTWGRVGLYSYVQGKMALEDGNTEEGIILLQEAEASLEILFTPLRERIRSELEQLGAQPLQLAASVMLDATSIPTIPARPTARPLLVTPSVTPELGTPTSAPPLQYPPLVETAIIIDTEKGTGKIVLLAGDYPLFRFQPVKPVKVKAVKNIVIHLVSSTQAGTPPIHLSFFSPQGGWHMHQDLIWGDNPVKFPQDLVYPEGDVFLAVRNWSEGTVVIDNLIVSVIVETEDGRIVTIGPK